MSKAMFLRTEFFSKCMSYPGFPVGEASILVLAISAQLALPTWYILVVMAMLQNACFRTMDKKLGFGNR